MINFAILEIISLMILPFPPSCENVATIRKLKVWKVNEGQVIFDEAGHLRL